MPKPAPQAKRGTKAGTKLRKAFSHVCANDVDCERNGEPFMGTAKAVCCSPKCNLKVWRRRQAADASYRDVV